MTVTECLQLHYDEKNADFQARLAPTIPHESCLGVRTPVLREIARQYCGTHEAADFLKSLPHRYYDENMLHSVFISNIKNTEQAIAEIEAFLPYMDNWAVCDTLRPKAFKRNKDGLMEKIKKWIASPDIYTCRFGVGMLMAYYLDDDFQPSYLSLPAAVRSDEYYVNMMIAWYYATALAKRWDETIPFLQSGVLEMWVHNKTIQKARESFRITAEQKDYLKTLKRM